MPKPSLKNPFARRKSSGNVLDVESPGSETPTTTTTTPPQSSFRVIERHSKNTIVFGDDRRTSAVQRPFQSPLQNLRGKSVDDLTYHTNGSVDAAATRKAAETLKGGRGSAGTMHSGSSDVYQSSSASNGRHSSSSTLPSSVSADNDDDEDGLLFPAKRDTAALIAASSMASSSSSTIASFKSLPPPPEEDELPLPPPPTFSARAQRAFSFGLRSKHSQDKIDQPTTSRPTTSSGLSRPLPPSPAPVEPSPPLPSHSPVRERALTTSSYASTAVPSHRLDTMPDLGTSDFGGDFSSMFEKAAVSSPTQLSPDTEPSIPPQSRIRRGSTPGIRRNSNSPFWNRRTSRDGLLASAATSPSLVSNSAAFPSHPVAGANVTREEGEDSISGLNGYGKEYELQDPQEPVQHSSLLTTSAPASSLPLGGRSTFDDEVNPWDREASSSTTPRAPKRESILQDEELFDVPLIAPPKTRRPDPTSSRSLPLVPRKLTKAQFEILQRYGDVTNGPTEEDQGGDDSENDQEDEDDVERAKKVTMQRRKQEANMAVYRQQMKKVTGGGPTDLPARPNLDTRSSSIPSLHLGGLPATSPAADTFRAKQGDDDGDDDIPLGILQAHGFPSANRPPTRLGNDRPPSTAPQRNSQMPVFARRLPEDPYFGASLVNPSSRQSLAFGGASGSVYGGASAPPTPGGLVGVIVSEEQQRQARRGSPNPVTGTYNAAVPPMNRASSMMSLPQGLPQMPVMPPMPVTNDPQLQEFMQMQMHFMANMQAMLVAQQAQIQQQGMVPGVGTMPRPMSSASNLMVPMPPQSQPEQIRATSMLTPPTNWNSVRPTSTFDPRLSMIAPSVSGVPSGYTPSIAPSERSNVGMPSRYRPVQTGEADSRSNSLTSSLTLNAFTSAPNTTTTRPVSAYQPQKQRNSTIRVIDKPKGFANTAVRQTDAEDEDDEKDGSWADMMKRKLKSKRTTRASKNGGGERVALSELYPNVEF